MLEKIKVKIKNNIGNTVNIKFNGSRNKIEEYTGVITDVYPFLFTVKLNDQTNLNKSFTYSDVLIETVELTFNSN